jgi:hypothetical protein
LDRPHVNGLVFVEKKQPHLQHFGVINYPWSIIVSIFLVSRQSQCYHEHLSHEHHQSPWSLTDTCNHQIEENEYAQNNEFE